MTAEEWKEVHARFTARVTDISANAGVGAFALYEGNQAELLAGKRDLRLAAGNLAIDMTEEADYAEALETISRIQICVPLKRVNLRDEIAQAYRDIRGASDSLADIPDRCSSLGFERVDSALCGMADIQSGINQLLSMGVSREDIREELGEYVEDEYNRWAEYAWQFNNLPAEQKVDRDALPLFYSELFPDFRR